MEIIVLGVIEKVNCKYAEKAILGGAIALMLG